MARSKKSQSQNGSIPGGSIVEGTMLAEHYRVTRIEKTPISKTIVVLDSDGSEKTVKVYSCYLNKENPTERNRVIWLTADGLIARENHKDKAGVLTGYWTLNAPPGVISRDPVIVIELAEGTSIEDWVKSQGFAKDKSVVDFGTRGQGGTIGTSLK